MRPRGTLRRVVAALILVLATVPAFGSRSAAAEPERLGPVTGFEVDADTYTFASGLARVRVIFYDDDLFRIWLAPDGQFTDPANTKPNDPNTPDASIVVRDDYHGAGSTWSDEGDHYLIRTDAAALRIRKDPLQFALYDARNQQPIWVETAPLSWTGNQTVQSLARQSLVNNWFRGRGGCPYGGCQVARRG